MDVLRFLMFGLGGLSLVLALIGLLAGNFKHFFERACVGFGAIFLAIGMDVEDNGAALNRIMLGLVLLIIGFCMTNAGDKTD